MQLDFLHPKTDLKKQCISTVFTFLLSLLFWHIRQDHERGVVGMFTYLTWQHVLSCPCLLT